MGPLGEGRPRQALVHHPGTPLALSFPRPLLLLLTTRDPYFPPDCASSSSSPPFSFFFLGWSFFVASWSVSVAVSFNSQVLQRFACARSRLGKMSSKTSLNQLAGRPSRPSLMFCCVVIRC